MTTQFCYQQTTAGFYVFGQLPQGLGRDCEMMQHHVEDDAVGTDFSVRQCIGQPQLNVSQRLALADAARQVQHHRAVVHRDNLAEAPGQLWQKAAVAGAYFQRRCLRAEAQFVEQCQQAFAVLRQTGDQVLLGTKLFGSTGKEILAGQCTLPMHQTYAALYVVRQVQGVHFIKQRRMQPAARQSSVGQGATVENRVAFTPRCNQIRLSQHLEVMAHAGLTNGKNLRQLKHAERIVGQHTQYVEPQGIAAGLAQCREVVACIMANGRYTQVHSCAV